MREQLATAFERLARREPSRKILRRLNLDPDQFALFLGLFRTLSEQEELMTAIGVNRFSISYFALLAAAWGVLPWFLAVCSAMPAPLYLMTNLLLTFAVIFFVIVREAPNALFNPVEASILAHNPVHDPTYAAAKIANVLIAVLYLVAGLTVYPAVIAIGLRGARWFWPVTHIAAGLLIGLTTAFLICAFYGALARLVPSNWLKGISTLIQFLAIGAMFYALFYSQPSFIELITARSMPTQWIWLPWTWFVQLGMLGWKHTIWRFEWQGALSIAVTAAIIWFGIRTFSGGYFSEASSMVQGQSWRSRKKGVLARSFLAIIRAITGSPLGLGAFCFVTKMTRRDWQYRRAVLSQAWLPIVVFAAIVIALVKDGPPPSPISDELSPIYVLPQILGLIAMTLCVNLVFTDSCSRAWVYLTAPIRDMRALAKGIYWGIWIPTAGLPHFLMLPFMIWYWGWKVAVLLCGFNLTVVSFYLAFEMTLISGVPFSAPLNETRSVVAAAQIQMCWLVVLMLPATIQWALFQIQWVALLSAIILAVSTWFALRWSLGELVGEIGWRLHLMKSGTNQMFKEID
jgi:hypothetical protein